MALNGVVADNAGNLYGVFQRGGPIGPGLVYELTNSGSGWSEQIVWAFTGGSDGEEPVSVIIDAAGNLYGATSGGGTEHGGVIFKLTRGSGGWSFTPLYDMTGTGRCGVAGRMDTMRMPSYAVVECMYMLWWIMISGLILITHP